VIYGHGFSGFYQPSGHVWFHWKSAHWWPQVELGESYTWLQNLLCFRELVQKGELTVSGPKKL